MMPGDFPAHTITAFQSTLNHRFIELFHERWKGDAVEPDVKKRPRRRVVLPVGLLLVVDEENGGDATAQELVKRFNLLHVESQNAIDFYFLGWEWRWEGDRSKGIQFNPEYLRLCRDALRTAGVKTSGGNAELILVDAVFEGTLGPYGEDRSQGIFYPSGIALNFKEAIYVNISKSRDEKEIPSVGDFLQSIIQAAKDVTDAGRNPEGGVVFAISDKLGLATAQQSFLDYILDKWGKIIGARKLAAVTTRNIGPVVDLNSLGLRVLSPTGS
jgi:hypothetical protein